MAMDRALGRAAANGDMYREAIARGRERTSGAKPQRQLGRVHADNTYEYLNQIPRPITARCSTRRRLTSRRALRVNAGSARRTTRRGRSARQGHRLPERTQEKDGSWYGRWGMNYIYGGSVLAR
jgi:squalene-hopene/tetraprenyl-beta-curcumene cyclase